MQVYPLPWKPTLQTQTGGALSSWQKPFGSQDGEHAGSTAGDFENRIFLELINMTANLWNYHQYKYV